MFFIYLFSFWCTILSTAIYNDNDRTLMSMNNYAVTPLLVYIILTLNGDNSSDTYFMFPTIFISMSSSIILFTNSGINQLLTFFISFSLNCCQNMSTNVSNKEGWTTNLFQCISIILSIFINCFMT